MESRSFQCETRLCLVNHFQGRVSCPYGQPESEAKTPTKPDFKLCHIPGTSGHGENGGPDNQIKVEVNQQYEGRKAADTVYCSCRCNGADQSAHYCKCPTGFQCVRPAQRHQGPWRYRARGLVLRERRHRASRTAFPEHGAILPRRYPGRHDGGPTRRPLR